MSGIFRKTCAAIALSLLALSGMHAAISSPDSASSADTQFFAAAAAADVQTSLTMTSEPGDYIGAGRSYNYTGNLTPSLSYGGAASFSYRDANNWWYLDFAAPASAPLKVGTYTGAVRYPFQSVTQPGLDVSGNGRGSNTLTGSFEIKKIIYGTDSTIVAFWATFEQHSEGSAPALRGEIKYNAGATTPSVNQAPGAYAGTNQRIVYPATASLSGIASDDDLPSAAAFTTTWSKLSGPGTITFADANALQTTASFSSPGTYVLRLTASDGQLSKTSDVTVVVVDPEEQTSLTMTSEPGDYIGAGKSYRFDATTGVFTASSANGAVHLSYSDASNSWYLDFAAPIWAPLKVGTYSGAVRYPFQNMPQAGLSVYGNGRGSNTVTGSFEIKKIIYGANNTIAAFWATFEQHSEGSAPALRGEIKFNAGATTPSVNQAPGVYAGADARVLLPNTASLSGMAVDDDLPSGNTLTTTWTKVSGPGTVTFADASALQTTATFSAAGVYSLQLTASDGALSKSVNVSVNVVDTSNTSLTLVSEEGDPIGQGATLTLTPVDYDFTLPNYSNNAAALSVTRPGSYSSVASLTFVAPNSARLIPGTIYNSCTIESYSSDPSKPRMTASVNGTAAWSGSIGSFCVKQVVYGQDGSISRLWVTFTVRNRNSTSALRGELRYHIDPNAQSTDLAPVADAGADLSVGMYEDAQLLGSVADDNLLGSALSATWTKASGPGVVTFANSQAARTSAGFSEPGVYVLRLTTTDGVATATDLVTVTKTLADTSLTMKSDRGDYIGGGASYFFTPRNGTFTASKNYDGGVSVSFATPGYDHSFYLNFATAGNKPLTVGRYTGATRFPFQKTTEPGLSVYGDGRGSNTLTGNFEVKQIVYGPGDAIQKFWVTFEQHSEGMAPALYGELRINADALPNAAPSVSAGEDVEAVVGVSVTLAGTVTDDEQPFRRSISSEWTTVSGPGEVNFGNVTDPSTTATFTVPGVYVLRLSATDGALTSSDEISISVRPLGNVLLVQAGPDLSAKPWQTAFLAGTVIDGSEDAGSPLSIRWSVVSGPGDVVFANANNWATTAQFAIPGRYVLRLTATNASSTVSDDLVATVTPAAGTFQGILQAAPTGKPSGQLWLQTTSSGTFTAKVQVGQRTYSFRGTLDSNGTWIGTVPRSGNPPLTVSIGTLGDGRFGATLNRAGTSYSAELMHFIPPNGSNFPQALAGTYSFVLDADPQDGDDVPQGSGWGQMRVLANGGASLTGELADGSPFVCRTRSSADGVMLLNAPLYRGKGVIAGLVRFNAATHSDLVGTLQWFKTAGASKTKYPYGFSTPVHLSGSRLVKLPKTQDPLSGSTSLVAAQLTFTMDGFSELTIPVQLLGRNAMQLWPGAALPTCVEFGETGVFNGEVRSPETGGRLRFQGTILQKAHIGRGYFFSNGRSGLVELKLTPSSPSNSDSASFLAN
ncbi:PKD domain-containing protein [Verrucomicrobiota bacterium sgz303538]